MICSQCATIVVSYHGESFALHQGMTLADFLQGRGYAPEQRMVCAVNARLIAKTDYAKTELHNGDRIDVIAPTIVSVV